MKNLMLLCWLFAIAFTIQSQTFIPGGNVSGTWGSSQSPFHIQGNIEIHFDSTLVIEPGVEVLFDGSYKLTVHGLLDASGTETDSILFTAVNPTTGWQGIEFYQINEDLGTSNLQYCILTHGKKPAGNGGAIYVYQAENVLINHCLIKHNSANNGGGIYIDDGWIYIENSIITHNQASGTAGGITCTNSRPYFFNLQVTHNTSGDVGGIYFEYNPTYSYPFFEDVNITNNTGGQVGGLWLDGSTTLVLDNCRICYNQGNFCGGIALLYSSLGYWGYPAQKSQVYMNKGGFVHELFFESYEGEEGTIINLDTFTIINPDSYHVYPVDKFDFIDGIQHAIIEESDTDLYISESGSDENDGFTLQTPLRSFDYALRKIISNTVKNNTLWVLPGHYLLTESDSSRPVILKNNVKIAATVPGESIIDADSVSRVFYGNNRHNFTLTGLTIQNGHDSHQGGGIYFYSSAGLLDSCRITSNYAVGYYGAGGGVYLEGKYNLRFTNCDFIENTAEYLGGALRYYNFDEEDDAFIELNNCSFIENHSNGAAGGIYCQDNQISIKNCWFTANTSVGSGAGCYFSDPMPILTNCLFNHNISGKTGGGLYTLGGLNASSKIINCTFTDNQAISGSAIYQDLLRNLYCINSVFYNLEVPSTDLIHVDNSYNTGLTIFYTDYSDIQGGEASIVLEGEGAQLHWQEGNITDDPAYIDPANNDYSLNWNSPCIEAGKEDTTGLHLPETDLNGDPRIVNPRIDMGAYEFQLPVGLSAKKPAENSFKIYPAVTKSIITIEFPAALTSQTGLIKIYSSSGIEMKELGISQGMNTIEVDVSRFSSGIYFVTFQNSGIMRSIGRFIVIK
jgi:hypothetical protein